mmetsp:Transcript_4028/g.10390  ORF Transcript_4028/g.10390 Transcript_4028/m.10390 type:complete len:254 (+) Transcript_4028:544-1305(+)
MPSHRRTPTRRAIARLRAAASPASRRRSFLRRWRCPRWAPPTRCPSFASRAARLRRSAWRCPSRRRCGPSARPSHGYPARPLGPRSTSRWTSSTPRVCRRCSRVALPPPRPSWRAVRAPAAPAPRTTAAGRRRATMWSPAPRGSSPRPTPRRRRPASKFDAATARWRRGSSRNRRRVSSQSSGRATIVGRCACPWWAASAASWCPRARRTLVPRACSRTTASPGRARTPWRRRSRWCRSTPCPTPATLSRCCC